MLHEPMTYLIPALVLVGAVVFLVQRRYITFVFGLSVLFAVIYLEVKGLTYETIAENGGSRPNAARHYRVLRQIALDYPPLTRAVWRLLGDANTHRRWDATVRVEA